MRLMVRRVSTEPSGIVRSLTVTTVAEKGRPATSGIPIPLPLEMMVMLAGGRFVVVL